MKNYYLHLMLFGALLMAAQVAFAQQEDHFTQFMHYKLGFNPAYAGSTGNTRITAMGRQQWIGLEGAPQAQLLTFNAAPLPSLGVGASLIRSSVGIIDRYTLEGNYAYRFRLGNGYFGIGLAASIRLLQANYDELRANQPIETDEALPMGIQSRTVPNFGFGLYYNTNNFYAGVSSPRLIRSSIDLANTGGTTISREDIHIYAMTGFTVKLVDDDVLLQPNVLMKYVKGAPFDADFNLMFTFFENYSLGASYRLGGNKANSIGESVSGLLSAKIADRMMFGLSYDFTLSDLRDYNDGSAELFLHYFFGNTSTASKYDSPRFFGN
ncbi:PorP/SprF family type IX secretion system membrane protein [Phaeodactylibacter luteus]|uniref:Type IX secretion system membrane protein PorP/SprF n=1 Tax=Phaeodactylibacter luteus TaxID=1564516 RepID=A0A5C6RMM0_9BACT|nr:type IX secretion system membrane protein PorP/SprF [Phaeodactylibacter luteus]TXB63169.1 type IX secretion system membrane protein PorP/SprF [Phaeodactylibacter luteus]